MEHHSYYIETSDGLTAMDYSELLMMKNNGVTNPEKMVVIVDNITREKVRKKLKNV